MQSGSDPRSSNSVKQPLRPSSLRPDSLLKMCHRFQLGGSEIFHFKPRDTPPLFWDPFFDIDNPLKWTSLLFTFLALTNFSSWLWSSKFLKNAFTFALSALCPLAPRPFHSSKTRIRNYIYRCLLAKQKDQSVQRIKVECCSLLLSSFKEKSSFSLPLFLSPPYTLIHKYISLIHNLYFPRKLIFSLFFFFNGTREKGSIVREKKNWVTKSLPFSKTQNTDKYF